MYFSVINKAAYGFGLLFIIQGILFLGVGVVKPNMCFKFRPDIFSITGGIFVLYAMILYPMLGTYWVMVIRNLPVLVSRLALILSSPLDCSYGRIGGFPNISL